MKPKLTLKRTFQPKVDHSEIQRLCQAHFHFCESRVQNFKHLISKKEKELFIFQRTHTLNEVHNAQPRCIGYT